MYKLKLKIHNKIYSYQVDKNKSILQLALENDLDPPYSCESGSCGLCKAKKIEGNLELKEDAALSDDEINSSIILTCQAFLKEDSSVDFDIE